MNRTREVLTLLDREQAIHWALSNARPGDVVLIAGRGHETHQVVGEERISFDDREVASLWLREMEPAGMRG